MPTKPTFISAPTLKGIAEAIFLRSPARRRERLELAQRVATALASLPGSVGHRARDWATHFENASAIADDSLAPIEMPYGHQPSFSMNRWNDRDQIVRALSQAGWRSFEYPMPDVFLALATRYPGTIFDIGANTGFYSLVALSADATNVVESFEPDSDPRALLRSNALRNGFLARLTINDIALSNREADLDFYVPTQEHGQMETSSSLESNFKSAHSEVRRVHAKTLDQYVKERAPLRHPVSVIKIDVEGHEGPVVEGASETILRYRPFIFVELLPRAGFQMIQSLCDQHSFVDLRLRPTEVVRSTEIRFDPQGWNHLLVPRERLPALTSQLRSLGLSIRDES